MSGKGSDIKETKRLQQIATILRTNLSSGEEEQAGSVAGTIYNWTFFEKLPYEVRRQPASRTSQLL
jgi:hypothetical protein